MVACSFFANGTTDDEGSTLTLNSTLSNTFGVIFLVLALFASMGNGYILYVVQRDPLKCFNKPTNILNISIAATHLFAGVAVLPYLGILNILRRYQGQFHLHKAFSTVEEVLVNVTVGTATLFIFALSTERCTAVLFPHANKKWVTTNRVKTICSLAALTCCAFCVVLFTDVSKIVFYSVYLHVFILLPVCGICLSCVARLYTFKKQARVSVINSSLPMTQLFANETRKRHSQMTSKLLINIFTILLPISLSLLLFYAVKLLPFAFKEFNCSTRQWYTIMYSVTLILLFFTSALNPLVLIARIPEYARSVKHILRR